MILAGIDEAGYGPLLGPLVVGCCAFEIADADPKLDPPCLWKRLRKLVSKTRSRDGRKIHVNDSKLVYSPSQGIKELERSILALATAWQSADDDLLAFLRRVSSDCVNDLQAYAWYQSFDGESFPVSQDAMSVQLLANGLRAEMQRMQAGCVYLAARVLAERQLNHQFDATRNKSSVLFSTTAIHLDRLLRNFGEKGLVVYCDQQGGRHRYGQLLQTMLEDWHLESVDESDAGSAYQLSRRGHVVRVIFCEKAEAKCMPVAIASMLSKYLRETLMHRFNAFWKKHLPDLNPTAGYYGDGARFLTDIAGKRRELGIADADLVRSR